MDGKIIIGTEIDTSGFNEIEETIKQADKATNGLSTRLGEAYEEYKKLTSDKEVMFSDDIERAEELKKEITAMSYEFEKITGVSPYFKGINDIKNDTESINNNLKKIGSSMKGVIRSVGKWALAIFSVRSAYMLIRRAISTISQDDEELAAKIQYIGYVVAYTLKPIVEWIVNAVYKLLSIINGVLKGLFGISLNTEEAANAFGKANKNANSLKKTLAGFDEMNVLSDTSSSGGTGGGMAAPNLPDSTVYEENASNFKKMWEEMLDTNRMGAMKLFMDTDKTWGLLKFGWFDTIQGLVYMIQGVIDFIKGILQIIIGLITGDTEKIKEGFKNLIKGIIEILRGMWQFITGLVEMIMGAVWGVIKTVAEWVWTKLIQPVINWFKEVWKSIKDGFKSAFDYVKGIFNSVVNFFKNIISTIVGLFKNIGTKVGDAVGGAFKAVINGVLSAIENILNFPIKSINKLISKINNIPGIDLKTLSTFKFPRLARGGIVNNPGPGVMMGSYVAGERGAEAVLPLTDDTLQRLANMIPITVNLTNNMNGRAISREIIKTQNESNFAFNR